jgi:hypothetical protein
MRLVETFNSIKKKLRLITESKIENKTLVCVDVQPEYEPYITFNMREWVNFINKSSKTNNIVFLYNGHDTLGMVSKEEYTWWLYEYGIKDEVLNQATFYDKGYAFFRYCMDEGIDHNNIIDLIKYMMRHNINDSRDIDEDMWNNYMEETNHSQEDVRELLENASDMISIPDLMNFLSRYNNIVLIGGGVQECLKEVEIALLALNKRFNIYSKFTY